MKERAGRGGTPGRIADLQGWPMAAYFIVNIRITDRKQFHRYSKAAPAVVEQYGGRYIVRGGDFETLEGAGEVHPRSGQSEHNPARGTLSYHRRDDARFTGGWLSQTIETPGRRLGTG